MNFSPVTVVANIVGDFGLRANSVPSVSSLQFAACNQFCAQFKAPCIIQHEQPDWRVQVA